MINLTGIISAVLTLIVAVLSAYLIPLIKRKVDAEKLATIQFWVGIAVDAAEQVFRDGGLGAEKKKYVVNFLEARGFSIDADELNNLIEAAVLEMKNELY